MHHFRIFLRMPRSSAMKEPCSKLLLFSHSVVSTSLLPYGLQHARLPCPSLFSGVCSNSCLLSPTISSSVIPSSSFLQSFPASIRVFPKIWLFTSGGAKYWSFSFSISASKEYSGLIFLRIDWFDLSVQGTLKSLLEHQQFKDIGSSALSLFYCPALTSACDYWENHSFDLTDLCWQSNVSAF